MKKNIISIILIIVLCFTFVIPPKRSDAIAFVPAMPVVIGLLKAAGLTALTVGGANYLYNEFYNYIPSEMRVSIDSMNNGSTAVLAGALLTYLNPFALTKTMGTNSSVIETTGIGSYQLNTWYTISSSELRSLIAREDLISITGLTNTTNYIYPAFRVYNINTTYLGMGMNTSTTSAFNHYDSFGDMKFLWERNPLNLSQVYMKVQYINNAGQYQTYTSLGGSAATFASLGYLSTVGYVDRSLDYSGSISADKHLDENGDIKPEGFIHPGLLDWLRDKLSGDAMPTDYINKSAQDVAEQGYVTETGVGDTVIDLTGTNNLLSGIKSVIDSILSGLTGLADWVITGVNALTGSISSGISSLVDSVAAGLSVLTGSIATGIAALTDFVVPDVTLDFSGFQNLGSLMVQKFPFSLPWDLKNLIVSFNADPEPIKFENLVIYKNPYNNVMYDIDFDLTEWEWLAAITRYFILAAFSLGLIFKTRDLIKS